MKQVMPLPSKLSSHAGTFGKRSCRESKRACDLAMGMYARIYTVTRRHAHTRTGDLDGVENLVGVRGPADPNCGRHGREALAARVPRLVPHGSR